MDVKQIRSEFPFFTESDGPSMVYLDSAATSQKPYTVLASMNLFYSKGVANVHRGVHRMSDATTQTWEEARTTIARFFSAEPSALIITRNTTESLNGVAYGWGDVTLKPSDKIVCSVLEHHASLVTWQQLARRTGAELIYLTLSDSGDITEESLQETLKKHGDAIRLVSFVHVSNVLGTVTPIKKFAQLIRKFAPNAKIVVDGAQAAPHLPVNFPELDVDFYAFSGHKMLGPMGVGGLLVKGIEQERSALHPWFFGGGMISSVSRENSSFHENPIDRFTAGTPDVASTIGLAAACNYLHSIGMRNVAKHSQELVRYTIESLQKIPEITIAGPQHDQVGLVSFLYEGVHAHDVAQVLDSAGVAVRSGHHCTMPLHTHFSWPATTRASFHVYSTQEDVDALISGLHAIKKVFSRR